MVLHITFLRSYLTQRQQIVEFDGFLSKSLEMKTGVPQRSVLGPFLFSIYINDVQVRTNLYKMIMYADDTTLFCDINNIQNLEIKLNAELLKDIQLHSFKKNAFCLKTSHFINKYDPPRSQLCQWPRLVHNCNQSFNMSQPSVYFDSHQNIPASHLGIPGGIFIVTINFNLIFITQFSFI